MLEKEPDVKVYLVGVLFSVMVWTTLLPPPTFKIAVMSEPESVSDHKSNSAVADSPEYEKRVPDVYTSSNEPVPTEKVSASITAPESRVVHPDP